MSSGQRLGALERAVAIQALFVGRATMDVSPVAFGDLMEKRLSEHAGVRVPAPSSRASLALCCRSL